MEEKRIARNKQNLFNAVSTSNYILTKLLLHENPSLQNALFDNVSVFNSHHVHIFGSTNSHFSVLDIAILVLAGNGTSKGKSPELLKSNRVNIINFLTKIIVGNRWGDGNTTLHLAAFYNVLPVIRILLQFDWQNVKNAAGFSVTDLAKDENVRLLLNEKFAEKSLVDEVESLAISAPSYERLEFKPIDIDLPCSTFDFGLDSMFEGEKSKIQNAVGRLTENVKSDYSFNNPYATMRRVPKKLTKRNESSHEAFIKEEEKSMKQSVSSEILRDFEDNNLSGLITEKEPSLPVTRRPVQWTNNGDQPEFDISLNVDRLLARVLLPKPNPSLSTSQQHNVDIQEIVDEADRVTAEDVMRTRLSLLEFEYIGELSRKKSLKQRFVGFLKGKKEKRHSVI